MLALFALGSIGFWVMVGIEVVVLLALIEYERPWWASFTLLATGLFLHFVVGINLLAAAVENPGTTVLVVAGYFLAGTAWATVKWFLHVIRKKEEYLEAKESYSPQSEAQNTFDRQKDAYVQGAPVPWDQSHRRRLFLNSKGGLAPLARENKERIMLWMVYWPFSAVWTIINDPIKRLFRHIFNLIQNTLQGISNRVFADVK